MGAKLQKAHTFGHGWAVRFVGPERVRCGRWNRGCRAVDRVKI